MQSADIYSIVSRQKGYVRVAFLWKATACSKEEQRNQKERTNLVLSSPFALRTRNSANM